MGKKGNFITSIVFAALIAGLAGVIIPLAQAAEQAPPTSSSRVFTSQNQPIADVTITASGIVPATISIPAGGVVRWTNQDRSEHSLTFVPVNTEDSSPAIAPGQTFTMTFSEAQTLSYTVNGISGKNDIVVKE